MIRAVHRLQQSEAESWTWATDFQWCDNLPILGHLQSWLVRKAAFLEVDKRQPAARENLILSWPKKLFFCMNGCCRRGSTVTSGSLTACTHLSPFPLPPTSTTHPNAYILTSLPFLSPCSCSIPSALFLNLTQGKHIAYWIWLKWQNQHFSTKSCHLNW